VVKVTGAHNKRVSVAALLCTKPGHRPRLIYRVHYHGGRRGKDQRSDVMAGLIAARGWLTVYRLPPYAHELNPVEPVWSHLKRSLANLAKRNLAQLIALIKTRLKRMQYRPSLLDGFLASTRLDLTPFYNPAIEDV
jgi:putative transposase